MNQTFKLTTKLIPTGDQPQAIEQLTQSVRKNHNHQTLMGVTGSGKTFTLANVINKINKPTLIISHNKTLAAQLYQEFRDFFPQNAVSYFVSYYDYYQPESYIPSTDTYIEKETDINDEIDKLRLSTTANLLTRPDVIVIASVSCIYNLGSPLEYAKNFLELVKGQIIERQTIAKRLIDMQYERLDYEFVRGTFRLKGDVLQVWPANTSTALEISLLENTIESINSIDPVTLVKLPSSSPDYTPKSPRHIIYPAKHYQSNIRGNHQVFKLIKKDLSDRLKELKHQGKIVESYRLAQKVKHDLEMIKELGYVSGIENYSRYFDGRNPGEPPYTLLDYFTYNSQQFNTGNFLTIIDESHITIPQLRGMFRGDRSRKQTLIDFGFRLPSALDNRPLQFPEIMERLPVIIHSSATPRDWELSHSKGEIAEQIIRPTGLIDPAIEIKPSENQIDDLIVESMKRIQKSQRVLVTTLTKRTAEALTEYLNDPIKIAKVMNKLSNNKKPVEITVPKVQYLHADVNTLDRSDILDSLRLGEYDVIVGINLLREGLDLPEVSLVAILEADKQGFLRSRSSLIQTMGRASRHVEGKVILYADSTSQAMSEAIKEVNRRRKIQQSYNSKHGIVPSSISKPIREKLLQRDITEKSKVSYPELSKFGYSDINDIDTQSLTPKDKKDLSKALTKRMNEEAANWNFEKATILRDLITDIKTA